MLHFGRLGISTGQSAIERRNILVNAGARQLKWGVPDNTCACERIALTYSGM